MHVLPSDALAASIFALGLSLDFVRREDVIRWADRRIHELDKPPIWIIDLALAQKLHIVDFIASLKQIGAEVEPTATCEAVYALLPDVRGFSFDQTAAMAKLVYRITRQCLNDNWHHPLLCETDEIADTFTLVRDGFTKMSEHEATKEFNDFIEGFRNDGLAKSLSPVVWSRVLPDLPATSKESMGLLRVGISAWIIQDGNYGDFSVGDECRFALEFYPPEGLRPVTEGPAVAEHFGASRYRIRGKIIFRNQNVWVIDANAFLAYQERQPPPFAVVGTWVEGLVYLGIDPFFYFEYLHRTEGMPPLTYTWLVRQIMRETTPWIEAKDAQERAYRTRDDTKESFVPTRETKAWHDDDGHGHYVLTCERISGPTKPGAV